MGLRRQRYTKRQIAIAIRKGGGFVTRAAELLKCSTWTVYEYIKRYPELQIVVDQIREDRLDVAEASLLAQVQDKNTIATIFMLKCLGKKRGYVEAPQQHLHAHGAVGEGTWVEIISRAFQTKEEQKALPSRSEDSDVVDAEFEELFEGDDSDDSGEELFIDGDKEVEAERILAASYGNKKNGKPRRVLIRRG